MRINLPSLLAAIQLSLVAPKLSKATHRPLRSLYRGELLLMSFCSVSGPLFSQRAMKAIIVELESGIERIVEIFRIRKP